MQHSDTLSLAPPPHFLGPMASLRRAAAPSSSNDQSPSVRPSVSLRSPSSLVSYILSQVTMLPGPSSTTCALSQQRAETTPSASATCQQRMDDLSAAVNRPQSPAAQSYLRPYTGPLPPHYGSARSLPLSLSYPVPLSPQHPSIAGLWQPVSRSIHLSPPASLLSLASSSAAPPSCASPVISPSCLHRSRTSPLPDPPSIALPSSTAAVNSFPASRSQLSPSCMSLSPHTSTTAPLVRSTSQPHNDTRDDPTAASTCMTAPHLSHNSLGSVDSASSLASAIATSPRSASLTFLHRPLQSWTADEVWMWLHHLNLSQYALFHHRSIDGDMLSDMTDDDLRTELGVDDKFHRGKILKRIREHIDHQQRDSGASIAYPSWADGCEEERECKPVRPQRHRPRAASYHVDRTTIERRTPPPQPRPQRSTDINRYDYYVMQYEIIAALDYDDEDGLAQTVHASHDTVHMQRGGAVSQNTGPSTVLVRRRLSEDGERFVHHSRMAPRSYKAELGYGDSSVSRSGWYDEAAEKKEREAQWTERHRRRMQLRAPHDHRHQPLSVSHLPLSMYRSHSVDFSSDVHSPVQSTLTASPSASSLSAALPAAAQHRLLASLPTLHPCNSPPQTSHASAISPLTPYRASSHPSHPLSDAHPSHSATFPQSTAALSDVPSRIDRLSSVLRSSPTFIDEVTDLTILSSGAAGYAYSGMFHSLPVVVKLPKTVEVSGQQWREWRHEWQCHVRLPPHPNLVRFVGPLVMADNNYLVTELVQQGSLQGVLAAGSSATGLLGVYSSGYAVLRAALDIARGLSHMHQHRMVHRDISSRNILVDADGTCIIADLGLCREMNKLGSETAGGDGSEGGDDGSEQYAMSRPTAIPVRWTSPEALLTSSYTSHSDVWALGVTLWEMTAGGAVPYQQVESNWRLIQQVVDGTAQLTVDARWEPTTDVGRRARRIIQLCLTREVDHRPNSSQLVQIVQAEMAVWEHEAAEEAQLQRDTWRTHHEQLLARWQMNAQETAGKGKSSHQQLIDAATAARLPLSSQHSSGSAGNTQRAHIAVGA